MVTYKLDDEKLICTFAGQLNTDMCLKIVGDISAKVTEAKKLVVFDLQGVDYIASAFLRICARISKEVGAGKFSIIHVSPNVKKIFKLAGLDKFIKIE